MIYDLDYNEIYRPKYGETYRVPCVHGLPIILPSHVDHGDDGPTGKHWHSDARFDNFLPWTAFDDHTIDYLHAHWGYTTRLSWEAMELRTVAPPIIRDEGQPIEYKEKVARDGFSPTGEVFHSLIALYNELGSEPARNMKCVHHATPLHQMDDCLACPAHGMRYKKSGDPRFVAPFFLKIRNNSGGVFGKVPAATGDVSFAITQKGAVSRVALVDSLDEEIAFYSLDVEAVRPGDIYNLHLGSSWPKESFCGSLRK